MGNRSVVSTTPVSGEGAGTHPRLMTDETTAQTDAQLTDRIERTDVGVSLTVKLTRGTGTRDQDAITAKVKATTLEEAREDMDELRAYVRALAADVRAIQPTEE